MCPSVLHHSSELVFFHCKSNHPLPKWARSSQGKNRYYCSRTIALGCHLPSNQDPWSALKAFPEYSEDRHFTYTQPCGKSRRFHITVANSGRLWHQHLLYTHRTENTSLEFLSTAMWTMPSLSLHFSKMASWIAWSQFSPTSLKKRTQDSKRKSIQRL